MRSTIALAALLAMTPAWSQSPATVPLPSNTPSAGTTVSTPPDAAPPPRGSEAAVRDPNARNRPNGLVAPPAAINTGVQVIAPERK